MFNGGIEARRQELTNAKCVENIVDESPSLGVQIVKMSDQAMGCGQNAVTFIVTNFGRSGYRATITIPTTTVIGQ
jgi:hypothetical protein